MTTMSSIKSIRNSVVGIKQGLRNQKKNLSKFIWNKIGALMLLKGTYPDKISCSMRTLYRLTDIGVFDKMDFPSNDLLRRKGLSKQMDFTSISQNYLSAIADKRNRIPRKSLNYQHPYQVFLSDMKSLTSFDNLGIIFQNGPKAIL
nr:hypothetical protein [Streptococcus sp. DD13]